MYKYERKTLCSWKQFVCLFINIALCIKIFCIMYTCQLPFINKYKTKGDQIFEENK